MTQKGFSLLEVVIYIALFSMLMSGVLVAVYSIIEGSNKNLISVGSQEEGIFINRKIAWALTGATAIATTSTSTLVITRPDLGAQSPLTLTEIAGAMVLSRGGAAPVPLNSERYTISSTTFTVTAAAGGLPPSVKAEYRVNDTPFVFKSYLHH